MRHMDLKEVAEVLVREPGN